MKVLLQDDVRDIGYFGDVIEVKDGYARNYLLPQGLAIVPSENNIRMLAEEKQRRAKQRMEEFERLEGVAEKIEGADVIIKAKANPQGHLFGSVAERDIADNLRSQGFEDVEDDMVKLGHHLKEVGYYSDIKVKFAAEITASVNVLVVDAEEAEGKTEEELKEELRAKKVEEQQSAVEMELVGEEEAETPEESEQTDQPQQQQEKEA